MQYMQKTQNFFDDDHEARDDDLDSKVLGSLGLDGGDQKNVGLNFQIGASSAKKPAS